MKLAIAFLLASALGLTACASWRSSIPMNGSFAGIPVSTTVDDPVASYYVESYLAGIRRHPAWDAAISGIHTRLAGRLPTSQELALWSREYSPDFATLMLARRLLEEAERQPLYRLYRDELAAMTTAQRRGSDRPPRVEPDFLFLFVPGWLYRKDPATGADLARFRTLLGQHGARVELVESGENASVEENAGLIAERIRVHAASRQQVIVVSASKGGPETALALSMLGDAAAGRSVKAWVNIGGLLHGTPLADAGLVWPVCWFVAWAVVPDGSFDGIRSLTVERSARRWRALRIPEHVLVVNYVGVPLSGQVSDRARGGYGRLRAQGPNDGLTILTEALVPTGVTVPEFGVDHYFLHPDVEARTLSLARAVIRHVKQATARQGDPAER